MAAISFAPVADAYMHEPGYVAGSVLAGVLGMQAAWVLFFRNQVKRSLVIEKPKEVAVGVLVHACAH